MFSVDRIMTLLPFLFSFVIWAFPNIKLEWKLCVLLAALIITLLLWSHQTKKKLNQTITEQKEDIDQLSKENEKLNTNLNALSARFDKKVSDEIQYLNVLERIDRLLLMANLSDQDDKLRLVRREFIEETETIRLGGARYEDEDSENHQ